LQANAAETPGTSGPLGKSGTISFGGGALQYSLPNTYDYSPRFTNAANQSYSVDLNGQTVTWATPLTSSNGTLTVNSSAAGGKLILAATNTYTGDTTVLGGVLSVSSDGMLGAAATGNIVLDGGTLSAATNFTLNSSRTVFLGPSSDGGGALDVAGGATLTFGGTIADNGAPGSLTKTGGGTLTLSSSSTSTYTGGTTINAGTVAITGHGTIGALSNLTIAAGATLSVSGATGGYTLGTGQTLVAGNGTSFVNGNLHLGSAALTLFWTNGVPSLMISGNKLVMNNNVTTVAVAGSTPLPVGVYNLISTGSGGSVSGVVSNAPVNVTGAGAVDGASLQITSGELYLNVHGSGATSTTLGSSAATQTYGNAVTFTASVSPANATGIVTFTDGTTTYGTAMLTNGQAAFTAGPGVLEAGVYTMSASYSGDATHGPSVSSIVTQTINQAILTVAANNVSRWLSNANPTLTASYIGFVNGETTAVLAGAPGLTTSATPASPIGNYPILITPGTLTNVTGNYSLTFTNGTLSVVTRSMPYPQGTAFPLMLYEVDDAPSAANVAPYGWNIIQDYGNTTNSLINSYLQLAYADSLGGDAAIPCGGDATTNFVEWPQSEAEAWIQGSMTNNNIGWWDMPEEMRSWKPTEVQLLKDYRAWVQLYDTNGRRPTYEYTPSDRIPTDQLGVVSNVDLVGTACYCEAYSQPHAWVRYKVAQSGVYAVALAGATLGSNYLAGQKTVVAVLYLADPGNGQLATPQQSYHDVWSAIASGAQGIAVYSYWHAVNDNPALTNNLNQFNLAASQISGSEIGQVVLYGAHQVNVGFTITAGPTNTDSFQPGDGLTWQYASLNVLCETWSNNVYVIAVNSTSNSVSAIITNLPATTGSATLLFELRSLPVTGNSFADTFPPWGAHVYKMAAAVASPPMISSIALAEGEVTLSCTGASGGSYVLQGSTNLSNPAGWLNLNTNTASSAGLFSFTNSASASMGFYRLRQQ
jgi:autotransporter-associated beta strand protein